MAQGWSICSNCSKRNCEGCSLARRQPESIRVIMPRVLDNIERAYIGKETAKV